MILSRGRRYLFIHMPKTGGTSMALALEARAMKDCIMLGDTPKARNRRHKVKDVQTRGRLWKHATLADLDGLVRPEELPDLFVFTMVRNPWARMLSYYHWLRGQSFAHNAVGLARRLTFAQFVDAAEIRQSFAASPARSYVTDAQGRERCDLFIRLEHFARDVAPLEAHLGFELALPQSNRSGAPRDYRAAYDPVTRETVAQVCAEDIARFGYRFDQVD
ncbi:sulfotransferase family protein [Sulfitobacter sp. S190]|uniref:sulfotransferase family protein n=1 Tax=Sulfitobacter sp. S190 TaxID=2867022 RepID=UPI0021A6DFA7|nr:sulfotransferase family protein [Sulfitobacter sp. S190]UWR23200.1 sulfotransferase family protein [Sulfitobacter sp. S190]